MALAALVCLFGARGAPARAATAPSGFSENDSLAALLWEIAGYFTPETQTGDAPHSRRLTVKVPLGEMALTLSFADLDPWPLDLELRVKRNSAAEAEDGGEIVLRDRRPFGAESEAAAEDGAAGLEAYLLEFVRELRGRPKILPHAFTEIRDGLFRAETRAAYGVRWGENALIVVKADPRLWAIRPYGESEDPAWAEKPAALKGWTERLPQSALIANGGQYYPDRSSMGYLKRRGQELEARRHPQWKGFLLNDPRPGDSSSPFRVMDLEVPRSLESLDSYETALQSYMTLDRLAAIRVRDTDNLASRVAVGEDGEGRIAVVVALGGISLGDLATLLLELEIFPALSLDGGLETQLALREGAAWRFYQGEITHNAFGNFRTRDYHPSLPQVLALVPREDASDPAAPAPAAPAD